MPDAESSDDGALVKRWIRTQAAALALEKGLEPAERDAAMASAVVTFIFRAMFLEGNSTATAGETAEAIRVGFEKGGVAQRKAFRMFEGLRFLAQQRDDCRVPQKASGSPTRVTAAVTPEVVKELHEVALKGLVDAPGAFRRRPAFPRGCRHFYASPRCIEQGLESCTDVLIDEQVRAEEDNCQRREDSEFALGLVRAAATFFVDFLQVHPFSNGNGRCARLLVAHIMSDVSELPALVWPRDGERSTYIDALVRAREGSDELQRYETERDRAWLELQLDQTRRDTEAIRRRYQHAAREIERIEDHRAEAIGEVAAMVARGMLEMWSEYHCALLRLLRQKSLSSPTTMRPCHAPLIV